jgi:hypothetical protein
MYKINTFGPTPVDVEITTAGTYSVIATDCINMRVYLRVLSGGNAVFKDVSVKRILEVAP